MLDPNEQMKSREFMDAEISRLNGELRAAALEWARDKLALESELLRCQQFARLAAVALRHWDAMEDHVANCDPDFHDPEYAGESCERCFPHCDRARLALRKARDFWLKQNYGADPRETTPIS